MTSRPDRVGILAVELVFPSQYVDQTDLELYDGVSAGKYTLGLGQTKMAFTTDREDVNSFCLTALRRLLDRNDVDPSKIGRLEVGTETLVDKSKSVKTVLMSLLEEYGVTDLEGVDCTNACYGGTAVLFNSVNWLESSAWDGRLAVCVAADIAVYEKGAARPTGGAGAVAMLLGPNAPLALDRGVRSTFMKHAYDFYKPDLASEYPIVDGPLSIKCYLQALDTCYRLYRKKMAVKNPNHKGLFSLDAMLFHTPYCKLVQKSFARLAFNDYIMADENERADRYGGMDKFNGYKLEETYNDRDVEKAFMAFSKEAFEKMTAPALKVATNIGNMCTASVYGGLTSLLANTNPADLAGKSIGVFSYGSGLAASMFSLSVTSDVSALEKIMRNAKACVSHLDDRIKVSPESFTEIIEKKETTNHLAPYTPSGSIDDLFPNTFYLESVDEKHRRFYKRK